MRKIKTEIVNNITISNIRGYFEKRVTRFGTGAKVDIPKEHLTKRVIVIVCKY